MTLFKRLFRLGTGVKGRVVVAVAGVSGSGKSTSCSDVAPDLVFEFDSFLEKMFDELGVDGCEDRYSYDCWKRVLGDPGRRRKVLRALYVALQEKFQSGSSSIVVPANHLILEEFRSILYEVCGALAGCVLLKCVLEVPPEKVFTNRRSRANDWDMRVGSEDVVSECRNMSEACASDGFQPVSHAELQLLLRVLMTHGS